MVRYMGGGLYGKAWGERRPLTHPPTTAVCKENFNLNTGASKNGKRWGSDDTPPHQDGGGRVGSPPRRFPVFPYSPEAPSPVEGSDLGASEDLPPSPQEGVDKPGDPAWCATLLFLHKVCRCCLWLSEQQRESMWHHTSYIIHHVQHGTLAAWSFHLQHHTIGTKIAQTKQNPPVCNNVAERRQSRKAESYEGNTNGICFASSQERHCLEGNAGRAASSSICLAFLGPGFLPPPVRSHMPKSK